ncbi:homocysteine S-methyltransferase family protein [candidate division FCPU426 bacterium]|nr:homocysteine S-methyltransferase family protein [candidate division FCPU426 bacterium]
MSNALKRLLAQKVVLLDGSTGTMLQKYGMPAGTAPEVFCLENPGIIQRLQQEYIHAGSDILLTPTFGANRNKLKNYHLQEKTKQINTCLAEMTLNLARQHHCLVAGDIGPTGLFFQPFGEMAFEEGVGLFKEQISALSSAGVDLFIIETQIDIQEARAALLAAKEASSAPVLVSMTFDESGRTLTGTDPLTCLNILQALGADGFGLNCSTGPDKMLPVLEQLRTKAKVPLFVKPNAGLPVMENGDTVFPMSAEEFASYTALFWKLGVAMIGGCCGTTPLHMAQVAKALKGKKRKAAPDAPSRVMLSSARKSVALYARGEGPMRVIGERINPTGKPALQAELRSGKLEAVKNLAREQKEKGADILDVNVGLQGIDEKQVMMKAVSELAVFSDLPLCIDSSRPETIEAALRIYPGRALVNSLSGEEKKLAALLPVIRKYGAAFIILPLDDEGIPETFAKRKAVLRRIHAACRKAGVAWEDGLVDGLVMTVSSNPTHARLTLETVRYAAQTLGGHAVLGLSNISFGLPGREYINGAFLAMAAGEGLSAVIANPGADLLMQIKAAVDVLTGGDPNSRNYLRSMQGGGKAKAQNAAAAAGPIQERIQECILQGRKEGIESLLHDALEQHLPALEIINAIMMPAIQKAGDLYNRREYFLPQLLASAETMEKGVGMLTPHISRKERPSKGRGVIATVKGDIHDIGKKIVALLLRNHGYEIIDLGKSVDEETIIGKALEYKADFIGLSALMTTTMTEMQKVVALAKKRRIPVKIILGGAVVTQKYADEIGADGYAVDAGKSVELLNTLFASAQQDARAKEA